MKGKDEALRLFNLIPDGHAEPLQRPSNKYTDRILRNLIEDANKKGDCIINVGRGIYRPIPGNPVDDAEFKQYTNSDLSRARSILFMGHEFTEKWEERNTLCSNPIEEQIAKTLDDVSDELIELTLCATCSNDEDELLDAIYALTKYEENQ